MQDADMALIMLGSSASLGKAAVNRWRLQGKRVGLVRLRMIRPWPGPELVNCLAGVNAIGVFDQNLAPGAGGILFREVATTVATAGGPRPALRSFIGGLGGKSISLGEFERMLQVLEAAEAGTSAEPELLLTAAEWSQIENSLAIAGKKCREQTGPERQPAGTLDAVANGGTPPHSARHQ